MPLTCSAYAETRPQTDELRASAAPLVQFARNRADCFREALLASNHIGIRLALSLHSLTARWVS